MAFLFLLLYLVSVLIRPHEWFVLVNDSSTIVRDSLIACMIFFLFTDKKNLKNPHLNLAIWLSVAIAASVAASGWLGGALSFGLEFMQQALVPLLLVGGLVSTISRQYIVFLLIIVAAMIMVANGHVQATSELALGLVGNPAIVQGDAVRITYFGYLNDPNDLGMFFVMALPLVFLLKLKSPVLFRPVFWLAIVSILYGIFLTNSRGTLLAMVALILLWFWSKYGIKKSLFASSLFSPALVWVLSSFRTISADDESAQGRLDAWYEGIQLFIVNPIFGVGRGSFTDYHHETAHNSFVLAIAELGLFGSLAWVGLLVVTVITLFNISEKNYLNNANPVAPASMVKLNQEALIARALLFSFVGFMVSGFFLSRSYTPLLYIYVGIAAACYGRVSRELPEGAKIFDANVAAKWTLSATVSGILFVYILMKLFL